VSARYRFAYEPGSVYERMVGLVTGSGKLIEPGRVVEPGGLVVDLGCGFGAMAEPLVARGFQYLGVDVDEEALADVRRRGHDVVFANLADPASALGCVRAAARGRRLAAVLFADALEHLAEPEALLSALNPWVREEQALVVVSVPNVAHGDIAAKLLLGRFDVTPTGLLDRTHLTWFTERRLEALFADLGFQEVGRDDLVAPTSDQRFPPGLPGLDPATPLGRFLRGLGALGSTTTEVHQFVRAYRAVAAPARVRFEQDNEAERAASAEVPTTALVVLRPEPRLEELLVSLMAQPPELVELLACCEPSRHAWAAEVIGRFGPRFARRVGLRPLPELLAALHRPLGPGGVRGGHVVVLEPGEVAFEHFGATFADLSRKAPSSLLLARRAIQRLDAHGQPQEAPHPVGPKALDDRRLAALALGRAEGLVVALPAGALALAAVRRALLATVAGSQGAGFGWARLLDAPLIGLLAVACGVAWSPELVVLASDEAPARPPGEPDAGLPVLLERAQLWRLLADLERREAELAHHQVQLAHREAELSAIRASTSWRVTAPLRTLGSLLRRLQPPRAGEVSTTSGPASG
jgi:2-polyprenyl-3-methyl-5-hydroxy-6-metoxy-1,4-benzoquinol methylase